MTLQRLKTLLSWRRWGILRYNSIWQNLAGLFFVALDQRLFSLAFLGQAALFILFSTTMTAFGYLVNDLADRDLDRLHGKPNVFMDTHLRWALLSVAGALGFGTLLAMPFFERSWFLPVWLLWAFLAASYSLPPLRLKERGTPGLIATLLAQQTVPVALLFAAFGNLFSIEALIFVIYATLRGISSDVSHQMRDWRRDKRTQTRTYAVKRGYAAARRLYAFSLEGERLALGGVMGLLLFNLPKAPLFGTGMTLTLAWPLVLLYLPTLALTVGRSVVALYQGTLEAHDPYDETRQSPMGDTLLFIHHTLPSVIMPFYLSIWMAALYWPNILFVLLLILLYRLYSPKLWASLGPVRWLAARHGSIPNQRILFFDEVPADMVSVQQVGGKGYSLIQLVRAGFPTPPGFCITVESYQEFISANQLEEEIERLFKGTDMANARQAELVRKAIQDGEYPPGMHQEILAAASHLRQGEQGMLVAVRSSARAEDSREASFAGQHDTFLNVKDEAALLESIKGCWASLFSPHVLAYRDRMHPGVFDPAMAVVVQQMAPAEISGVMFTQDPLSGEADFVVEAVWGSGDSLVSGEAAPQRLRISRITAGKASFAERVLAGEMAHCDPDMPALPDGLIEELVRTAEKVETQFGEPQDIEWAWGTGRLYILQSRPITISSRPEYLRPDGQVDMLALLRYSEATGVEVWTNDNVGEVIPSAVTPLTWSVLEPLGNQAFGYFLRRIGVRGYPDQGLFGLFYDRMYFNQGQFQRLVARFYPSYLMEPGLHPGWLARLKAILTLIGSTIRLALWIPVLPLRASKTASRVPIWLDRAPKPGSLSETELWDEIQHWQDRGQWVMEVHLAVTIVATLLYGLLDKLVRRWSGGDIQAAALIGKLDGMQSAEMGRQLDALAALVRQDETARLALFNAPHDQLFAAFNRLPPENAFAQAVRDFLDAYGHSSLEEFELSFPRFREDIAYLMSLIRIRWRENNEKVSQNSSGGSAVPSTGRNPLVVLRSRLGWGPRRWLFEGLLRGTRIYSLRRENGKSAFLLGHSHLRCLYLEAGRRLVQQNLLAQEEDIFWITQEEVSNLLLGVRSAKDVEGILLHRKGQSAGRTAGQAAVPGIIEQRPDGSIHPVFLEKTGLQKDTERLNGKGALLYGVGASTGQVTGRARVIHHPAEAACLAPGEILVTRATNPSWAPLLLVSSGLVTEIGGLLSHGAIIAREYGLPAVLNVKDVTQIVQTGQQLVVDGDRGIVRLVDEP